MKLRHVVFAALLSVGVLAAAQASFFSPGAGIGRGPHSPAPAGGGVASITFDTSAVSTTPSVTGPAGIDAGDILVLLDNAEGAGIPTSVVPSGFTAISDITNAVNRRNILSYKKATGAEASASLTGMDGSVTEQKVLLVFHPNIPATTVASADPGGEATQGDPAAQTVTSASGTPPLIIVCGYVAAGTISPRTFTVSGSAAKDGEASENSFSNVYLAYKIYNSSPADVVCDMEDEVQNNFLQSGYITVQ